MYEQIISIFSSSEILATVSNNIDDLATIIDGYLSGANNLRIASIILMLLAFILFLFLVIIIYVKSIVSFLFQITVGSDAPSKIGSRNNGAGNPFSIFVSIFFSFLLQKF